MRAVRLEACCNDPMSHHETPSWRAAARLESQFQHGGIPAEEWGQSRMIPRRTPRLWKGCSGTCMLIQCLCTCAQVRSVVEKGRQWERVGMSADVGLGSTAALSPQELQIRGSLNPPQNSSLTSPYALLLPAKAS